MSVDLHEWQTKAEAAKRLGISERTLDRWITERKIERRYRAIHGRRPIPVLNPDDVDTLAAQLAHAVPETAAIAIRQEERLSPTAQLAQLGRLAALAGVAGDRHQRFAPWLTIDQAVEYSGLTEGQIRKLVKQRAIRAIARPLRISRDNLDNFAAMSDSDYTVTEYLRRADQEEP
jgi:hypothetical protein